MKTTKFNKKVLALVTKQQTKCLLVTIVTKTTTALATVTIATRGYLETEADIEGQVIDGCLIGHWTIMYLSTSALDIVIFVEIDFS